MTKKFLILFLIFWTSFIFIWNIYTTFASNTPKLHCVWLPWCENSNKSSPGLENTSENTSLIWISSIITELIKYISVIAVLAVMISWVMYMTSWWEEEKVKKAKNWIIWSLVWVLLSISAWWIINMINNINF